MKRLKVRKMATINKEMNTSKQFKRLGYDVMVHPNWIEYEYKPKDYTGNYDCIWFDLERHTVNDYSMDVVKAIIEQCKELGWLE